MFTAAIAQGPDHLLTQMRQLFFSKACAFIAKDHIV
jgi:hypothetical protein